MSSRVFADRSTISRGFRECFALTSPLCSRTAVVQRLFCSTPLRLLPRCDYIAVTGNRFLPKYKVASDLTGRLFADRLSS